MDYSSNAPESTLADLRPTLTLRAPARLHLGFLDPGGSLGRRFGSVGLVIGGFETEVELSAAVSNQVSGSGPAEAAEIDRAIRHLHVLQGRSGEREPLGVRLVRVLPAHAGFGSGTHVPAFLPCRQRCYGELTSIIKLPPSNGPL